MNSHTVFDTRSSRPGDVAFEPVIELGGVSVLYKVPQERTNSFKDYAIGRLRGKRIVHHELWALRDVYLEVYHGETFGVIGRNGAGKSTLLKVVSRVLRPTRGRVRIVGRIAPLLELGAGFHPELTGRENVYLNASLLGRSRQEIRWRFDEIVAFAELQEFIDAPLRTYSSGMAARLGFAVATAWELDVLILDEILAVGDEAFQLKCKTKIDRFASSGVTILLVSHNADVIAGLCQRAVWLDRGIVRGIGGAKEIAAAYRNDLA